VSQYTIGKVLEDNYPKWMSAVDIMEELPDLSKQSIQRALGKMRKRDEVQILQSESTSRYTKWILRYRINKENETYG